MENIKFKFDKKIIQKEYSSKYFITTQNIFKKKNLGRDVTLKFFHFNDNVCIAGVHECLQLLKFCIPKKVLNKMQIYYLPDGTITQKEQPILVIRGNYYYFGHLENIIDGILSRRSSIATNSYNYIKVIGDPQKLLFMADRSDDYSLQKYDGYAAYIGGIRKFCTLQHLEFLKDKNDVQYCGTIPHALIQQFNGDIVATLKSYKNYFPNEPITALIDYNNDCIGEIILLKSLDFNVEFIRIDTSKTLIDKSLKDNKKNLYGVNHELITLCRKTLDIQKMNNTKIIVSSGIDLEQIKNYKKQNTPIDMYGVGKSLLKISVNFTGDLIKNKNNYVAKFGRNKNIEKDLQSMHQLKNT